MRCLRLFLLLLTVICLETAPVSAQPIFGPNGLVQLDEEEPAPDHSRLFISNRNMTRVYNGALEMIERGDYVNGLNGLQQILDQPEDYFFNPQDGEPSHQFGLKVKIQDMIAEMPPAGRRAYETQYGGIARRLLQNSLATKDLVELETVARRFFHTRAGQEANYRLGTYYLDHAEPLAAALRFSRLLEYPSLAAKWEPMLSLKTAVCWGRAGMNEQAVATLEKLKQNTPENEIVLNGRKHRFFQTPDQALSWMVNLLGNLEGFSTLVEEEWVLFRGNARRTSFSNLSLSLDNPSWSYNLLKMPAQDSPDQYEKKVRPELDKLRGDFAKSSALTLPMGHPLVINNQVIVRGFGNLTSLDLANGEHQWDDWRVDWAYKYLIEEDGLNIRTPTYGGVTNRNPLQLFLQQRSWQDGTAGTMSSDGTHLFSIHDLRFLGMYYNPRGLRHPLTPNDWNKLRSYNLDGMLEWEVGGPLGDRELPLAGHFFLGPPLPLGNQLYALAEYSGEVRLVAIRPRYDQVRNRAELTWAQPLVMPEETISTFPMRRLSGISPSYADGVMICPTTAGAVVAVDVSSKMLLWGYRYPVNQSEDPKSRQARLRMMRFGMGGAQQIDEAGRWLDSVPTIAEGRVLLTPRDSNELHCLSLVQDGKLLWKRARGEEIYLAGVYQGKVILVGRNHVRALNITDGSEAWAEPTPIPNPSGRGFMTPGFYHVPLQTGEIATVNLETGMVQARAKGPKDWVPGNLVSIGGRLVSQNVEQITVFPSVTELETQIAETLKKNPDDPSALALRGELRLREGETEQGLADLRASLKQKEDDRVARLMLETLLEGLRVDYGTWREQSEVTEQLAKKYDQQARFFRIQAEGRQKLGDLTVALAEYLKLTNPAARKSNVEEINGSRVIRRDRWLRMKVNDLRAKATPALLAEMGETLRQTCEEVAASGDLEHMRNIISTFDNWPEVDQCREALVSKLDQKKHGSELEFQLRQLRKSDQRNLVAFATARLASMYLDLELDRDAVELVEDLQNRWAEVVCLDGQTGKELVAAWNVDELKLSNTDQDFRWPERRIEAAEKNKPRTITGYYPMDLLRSQGTPFENWHFQLDSSRRSLVAYQEDGTSPWKFDLRSAGITVPNVYGNYAYVYRHLLIAIFGNQFAVFDTLTGGGKPRLLWKQSLMEPIPGQTTTTGVQMRQVVLPGGGRKMIFMDRMGRPLGKAVPISDGVICYQLGTKLIAAHPLTGDILWQRQNVVRGSNLLGDDEYIYVVPEESKLVLILRAADGKLVGSRNIPGAESIVSSKGSNLVAWRQTGKNSLLTKLNLLTGDVIWEQKFEPRSQMQTIEDDEVAILDLKGRFTVVSLATGAKQVDSQLKANANLSSIIVRRSVDRYILLASTGAANLANRRVVGIGYNHPVINGTAFGFDRTTGRKLWQTPVENQAFDPTQPDNLPVLVFAARLYPIFQVGQPRQQTKYAIAILDKRDGTMVYQYEGAASISRLQIETDREKKGIDVAFSNRTIELKFSEKPLKDLTIPPVEAPRPGEAIEHPKVEVPVPE